MALQLGHIVDAAPTKDILTEEARFYAEAAKARYELGNQSSQGLLDLDAFGAEAKETGNAAVDTQGKQMKNFHSPLRELKNENVSFRERAGHVLSLHATNSYAEPQIG